MNCKQGDSAWIIKSFAGNDEQYQPLPWPMTHWMPLPDAPK